MVAHVLLAASSILALGLPGAGRAELVYVSVGGSYAFEGAPRPGDPARIAARLRQTGRPVRLVDLTVEGATMRQVRESQLARTLALRPHLVTVAVGPADVAAGVPLASFARDLHVVTDLLRRAGATVAISTLPPAERLREVPSPAFRRRVAAFDWAIRRDAGRNGLRLADLAAPANAAEPSWEDAILAAIGSPPPTRQPAPRGRTLERAPGPGAAVDPPPRVLMEQLLAMRGRLDARGGRREARAS